MFVKPINSILVKPAGPDCNLACSYCFYYEKLNMFPETVKHRMTDEIQEEMIKQVMEQSGEQVSIGWQGGEPALMGLQFYRRAVELQKRYGRGQVLGNGIQTNGTLLNKEWADFFKRYNFLIGLSIDGPSHIHDHYRLNHGGEGTWARVSDNAKMLLDEGVAVNALTVVNNYSVKFPDEIYHCHKDLGFEHMQFIPCVETDPEDTGKAAPFSVSPDEYGRFLCILFDLWMSDFVNGIPTTSIRYFDSVLYNYVGMPPPECTMLPECGVYVVVEHNGDVYSCDFFVEPQWKLGNIMESRLKTMLNSGKQSDFGRLKLGLPKICRKCRWLKQCRGGCIKDRIRDPRDNNVNHFCGAVKMFYEHADSHLQRLAEEWKEKQRIEAGHRGDENIKPLHSSKVGRNDPCPCGSGMKYKKCCGRTSQKIL